MKKFLSMMLALIMIASLAAVIAIPSSAADVTPTTTSYASYYTGKADTSWYDNNPEATEYTLTSADQLAGFSKLVGEQFVQFRGVTIKLGVDIIWNPGIFTVDENGEALYNGETPVVGQNVFEFIPIGDRDAAQTISTTVHKKAACITGQFYGTFDGQGHTVSGLFYDAPDEGYAGFFTIFLGKAIKNLSIVNSYFSGNKFNGIFAGFVVCTESSYDIATASYTGNIGTLFENLYTNAYLIIKGKDTNAVRSGGIFGMIRPITTNMDPADTDPADYGFRVVLNRCWFDGTIWSIHATQDIAGLVGFAALDDSKSIKPDTTDDGLSHTIEFNECIVTGVINCVPETLSVSTTAYIRTGLVLGAIHRGVAKVENCVVALRSTNIDPLTEVVVSNQTYEFLPAINTKGEEATGKGVIGYYESCPVEVYYSNTYFVPIGFFQKDMPKLNMTTVETANGEKIDCNTLLKKEGSPIADATLANAIMNIKSDVLKFKEVDGKIVPYIDGIKTFVDPADPTVEVPDPSKEQVEDQMPPDEGNSGTTTKKPDNTTKKPDSTTAEPDTTTKPAVTTTADTEKSCGGFTAIGAVLALVAVTGAAIVIKKK